MAQGKAKPAMNNSVRSARAVILLLPFLFWSCASHPSGDQYRPVQAVSNFGGANALTVGPGKTYALPSEAASASKPGDIIQIFPGTYADCARWETDGLVIEGVGAGVTIADKVCDDKGLFITKGRDITVRNITFTSAHGSAHNGSGIRAEGVNLTVEDSRFIDNEDGILAGDNPGSTIVIRNSYFSGNGNCIAACAHGIYANHITLLRVENSEFSEQHVGHHIKSRAATTEIINNSVHDGPKGSASYLVDLPNGGSAIISGNRFEKGPLSQNRRVAISIGAEGKNIQNPPGEIIVEDNIFSNDTGVTAAFVKNYTDGAIILKANRFAGIVTPLEQPAASGKDQPGTATNPVR
jgi:hypothetical protein